MSGECDDSPATRAVGEVTRGLSSSVVIHQKQVSAGDTLILTPLPAAAQVPGCQGTRMLAGLIASRLAPERRAGRCHGHSRCQQPVKQLGVKNLGTSSVHFSSLGRLPRTNSSVTFYRNTNNSQKYNNVNITLLKQKSLHPRSTHSTS